MDALFLPQVVNEVEENIITLTSDSHNSLFFEDGEIIKLFDEQLNAANVHISSLEEKLGKSIENENATRTRLYEIETARHNEANCRTTFQRHLRLEQYRYRSLHAEHESMKSDLEALLTFNEMLRQEVEHHQSIIGSMATKISMYESAATAVIESKEQSWHMQQWDGGLLPPLMHPGVEAARSSAPQPCSVEVIKDNSLVSATVLGSESPKFLVPAAPIKNEPQHSSEMKTRKVKQPRKSKASSKVVQSK